MENDVSKVRMCLNINVTLIPHFSLPPICLGAHSLRVEVAKCKDWIKRDPGRGALEFCSGRHRSVICNLVLSSGRFPSSLFKDWARVIGLDTLTLVYGLTGMPQIKSVCGKKLAELLLARN